VASAIEIIEFHWGRIGKWETHPALSGTPLKRGVNTPRLLGTPPEIIYKT